MKPDRNEVSTVLRNIQVCYFLSGALGLVYQILWLRKLLLVFGSTVHAVSTVLTVFFAGLALGSWWFGRQIDKKEGAGLRWYAWLELGIGVYAFLTPWLFSAMQHVYVPIYRASGMSPTVLVGASFVCSLVILLFPTFLMGGTFPVMSRFLVRSAKEGGVTIANLYAINTAGAMAGTLGVYFFCLPMLGLSRTLLCAGVLNLGIGLLCLTFDRHLTSLRFHPAASEKSGAASGAEPWGEVGWLVFAFGLSGFASIAYEVTWTRALSLVLGSSIYAFCVILSTFLGGMALGSFYAHQQLKHKPATIEQFINIELALGLCGLVSLVAFLILPDAFVTFWQVLGNAFQGLILMQYILCMLVMVVPTILLGYLFPIVTDLVTRRFASFGQRLGTAYAVNTLGGILGSFLSGFILIPTFGLAWAVVIAALVNFAAASIIYVRFNSSPLPRRLMVSTVCGVAFVMLGYLVAVHVWPKQALASGAYLNPGDYRGYSVQASARAAELVYYKDSLNATVTVHRKENALYLKVGGKTDASNGIDMGTQVMSAHIPMLLHPNPKSALVIGLGSGVTLGNVSRYPVEILDCAELEPAVIEAARWFKEYNYAVHDDPRARLFVADGRNFLLASPTRYDVIISEPSNPWMAGVASLFTREFYELARERLAPGGVMCQWLQLYRIFPEDVKLILRTYHAVFPHVTVWTSVPGDLLLIGSMEPQNLDVDALALRMQQPNIAESLRSVKIENAEMFFQLLMFGTREVEHLTSDVRWNHEDDLPVIEFDAPKALYMDYTLPMNIQGFEQFRVMLPGFVKGYDEKREDAAFHRAMAELWAFRGERNKQRETLEVALRMDSGNWQTWLQLGQVWSGLRNPLRAVEALEKAANLAPREPNPARWLANFYWQQGDLEKASAWYLKTASLKAPDSRLAEEIGSCLRQAKQPQLAAEFYRSSLSQNGGDRLQLLTGYGQVLKDLRSWPEAERVLQLGRTAFPHEDSFWQIQAEILIDQGKAADAVPFLHRAATLAPRNVEAPYQLARIAMASGARKEAVHLLRQGLRQNPYHQKSLQLLNQLESQSQ